MVDSRLNESNRLDQSDFLNYDINNKYNWLYYILLIGPYFEIVLVKIVIYFHYKKSSTIYLKNEDKIHHQK